MSTYTEDEVLIFGGGVANRVIVELKLKLPELTEDQYDDIRNAAAEAAESQIKRWDGPSLVPLPSLLGLLMLQRAQDAALGRAFELGLTRREAA